MELSFFQLQKNGWKKEECYYEVGKIKMIKRILLSVLFVMPLLGKNSPQEAEFMAKLNKLEQIKKEIAQKEKYIDQLNAECEELFHCLSYGYDDEQKSKIWLELNKLEEYVAHSLFNNMDIVKAINEQVCPSLMVHRKELNRMQHITVRVCVEYFLLMKLYQQYNDIVSDILKIQIEPLN
jgi:hypothetical protein